MRTPLSFVEGRNCKVTVDSVAEMKLGKGGCSGAENANM